VFRDGRDAVADADVGADADADAILICSTIVAVADAVWGAVADAVVGAVADAVAGAVADVITDAGAVADADVALIYPVNTTEESALRRRFIFQVNYPTLLAHG
jgi:hypothetical protein